MYWPAYALPEAAFMRFDTANDGGVEVAYGAEEFDKAADEFAGEIEFDLRCYLAGMMSTMDLYRSQSRNIAQKTDCQPANAEQPRN
jgi:hypothetical protein